MMIFNRNTKMMTRFLLSIGLLYLSFIAYAQSRPNVLLIITDDQGYGDLGYTGNPHVKTPNIDKLAKESIRLNNFYVSPVCAPTRSSLMTGRYSLRTGIRDTYNGGATMAPSEVTIAEMLKEAGYTNGIFGKWHLGDNYPSRPNDQGFDESLIHLSGGMGQVGDFTTFFKGDKSYFDPILWHNGIQESYKGFCSVIFAQNALEFIEQNHQTPFFCYLSFNAPHTPLQVPEKYYNMYKEIDPSSGFEKDDHPFYPMSEKDKVDARKVYGMVSNIDDNIGMILKRLRELKIDKNTIVIFMTDNGPQQQRYLAGLRGLKSDVYRGGVRVPFFMRYPQKYKRDQDIETNAAHIDILPTLADLCSAETPTDRKIDGNNLVPLLDQKAIDWENRPIFFYWTRRYPERYNNVALQQGPFKLVGRTDYNAEITDFELFDVSQDPFEERNIVGSNKQIAIDLKSTLVDYFNELSTSENLINQPPIVIGSPNENPTYLNRNDAGGERGIWAQEEIHGKWFVDIQEGTYDIEFKFINPVKEGGTLYLETNSFINRQKNNTKTDRLVMEDVHIPHMNGDLLPYYIINGKSIFPFWVKFSKKES